MSKAYYKVHEWDGDPRYRGNRWNPAVSRYAARTLAEARARIAAAPDGKDALIFRMYLGPNSRPGPFYAAQEDIFFLLADLDETFRDGTPRERDAKRVARRSGG